MKEVKNIISLEPGDSLEIDNVTLITNCGGPLPQDLKVEIKTYLEDDESEEDSNHNYSIKFKNNDVLVQVWAKSYEIISRAKMKEIVEELNK